MTDTADSTPTIDIAASVPPVAAPQPQRSRFSWLAFFAFVFALISLAVAGWRTYRDQTESELSDYRLESAIRDQSLALSELRQQVADLRADDRSARQQLATQIEQQHTQLETLQQQLADLTAVDRSDWELADAEYLLQLANQRLLLGGDPSAAVELLSAADNIVRGLDDSGLLPVRAALAQDLAALKAVPAVDVEGIYLAISAASKQAAALPLIRPPEIQTETAATPIVDATWTDRLGNGLEAALQKLYQLVQVRRRDQPYQPLLAPEHEAALRQNLQLMFEQAQAALLSGNQALYSNSLEKAQNWITTYFTLDEQATRAATETLADLKSRQIKPQLPDVGAARRALNTFIKSRRALQDDNGNAHAGAAQ